MKAAAKQVDQSTVIESETIKSNTKTHFSEEKERESNVKLGQHMGNVLN